MSAITKLNGPASLTPGSFDDAKSFGRTVRARPPQAR
jgi:hypothetical protein